MIEHDCTQHNRRIDGRNYSQAQICKTNASAKRVQKKMKDEGYDSVRILPEVQWTKGKRTVLHVVYFWI